MGFFEQLQGFAQGKVYSIDLDRLLQDNFDYNSLMNSLPETFFAETSHVSRTWNFKGSVCVDLGHKGCIYGYALPQDIRFHKSGKLPIKIGKTDKQEPIRERIWQQSLPEYPQLLFIVTVPATDFVEDALHKFYQPCRCQNALGKEWFEASPSEVIESALWMSVLASMNCITKGELIELTRYTFDEPLLKLYERSRRLQEVRNCLLAIDSTFEAQGTNFKLGDIEGRGLTCSGRPQPLTSEKYQVKTFSSEPGFGLPQSFQPFL